MHSLFFSGTQVFDYSYQEEHWQLNIVISAKLIEVHDGCFTKS